MGGSQRGIAVFTIEAKAGKGERAVRVTTSQLDRISAPKALTFAVKSRIVDGDDGKTYVVTLTQYGHISVFQSNMQFQAEDSIFPDNPRYAALRALFELQETCG